MSLLVENAVKVSLIIAAALTATTVFRHRSAALRHWMLSTALVCAVLAPAFRPVAPAWNIGLDPAARVSQILTPLPEASRETTAPVSIASARLPSAPASPVNWSLAAGQMWMAGVAFSLLLLTVGFARLVWIAARSTPMTAGRWTEIAAELSREAALRRPVRLLQSDQSTLLVTWGIIRPDIILPRGASGWPDERIRVVLLHELAHISRGDWATQILPRRCARCTGSTRSYGSRRLGSARTANRPATMPFWLAVLTPPTTPRTFWSWPGRSRAATPIFRRRRWRALQVSRGDSRSC